MRLAKTDVIYDRVAHTYTLNGVRLCGVTEMIKYQLHPESYNGISDYVLAKAAKKGSWVHDMCESFDNFSTIPTDEDVEKYRELLIARGVDLYEIEEEIAMMKNAIDSANEYKRLTEGFDYLISEYVVTDGKNFASPIDKIYMVDENTVDIYDIKTISKMLKGDKEKVTWQCSIYAKWFEEMNPNIKVRNIGVVWLPDKKYWSKSVFPYVKTLERIPSDEVQRLLDAEVNDESYRENSVKRSDRNKEIVKAESQLPSEIVSMKQYVIDTLAMYKKADAMKKEMTEKVRTAMAAFNIKSWSTEEFSFSQSADSERKTFDVKAFEAAHPEIDLSQFYKTTKVNGGFTAKIKL